MYSIIAKQKGNVDTDIVFFIMRKIAEKEPLDCVFLVSGDGDYYRMIKYLFRRCKLGKVLHPSKKNASTLYRQLPPAYYDYLDYEHIKTKIAHKSQKKRASLR